MRNEGDSKENNDDDNESFVNIKRKFRKSILQRKASLTIGEQIFLHALLVDDNTTNTKTTNNNNRRLPATVDETNKDDDGNDDDESRMSFETAATTTITAATMDQTKKRKEWMTRAKSVLDDDVLFSTPFENHPQWAKAMESGTTAEDEDDDDGLEPLRIELQQQKQQQQQATIQPRGISGHYSYQVGLWKSFEHGVPPQTLARFRSVSSSSSKVPIVEKPLEEEEEDEYETGTTIVETIRLQKEKDAKKLKANEEALDGDALSVNSDEEVRPPHHAKQQQQQEDQDQDSTSSWGLDEQRFGHFDTWQVLSDEYAKDFGFGLSTPEGQFPLDISTQDDDDDQRRSFKILGTSADDISAYPHVLSPPLMDSLLNFVSDSVADQHFWLKFSLVRDGASLDTLRQYCRAATHTVLAIETTDGRVFGSFTSSPWHLNNSGYFGSGEAFLWKMRQSRSTPCASLMEQAQLESEIDVYFYAQTNDYIQLCTLDKIALGGGELDQDENHSNNNNNNDDIAAIHASYANIHDDGEHYGFGIAISDDLLHGTTSPCATFRNPCLTKHSSKGEVFEIVNLEVWSFTPMNTVSEAEHLEMTKFFIQESIMSSTSTSSTRGAGMMMMENYYSTRSQLLSERTTSSTTTKTTTISPPPSSFLRGDDLRQEDFYRRAGTGKQYEEEEKEVQASKDAFDYAKTAAASMTLGSHLV